MQRVSARGSEVRPDPGIAYSGVRALTQGQGVLSATLSLHRVLALEHCCFHSLPRTLPSRVSKSARPL